MDFDRRTGRHLSNYESALQSVEIILATRIGARVMRREFGAGLVELLGRRLTTRTIATAALIIQAAIDLWEPRFRVRGVTLTGSVEQVRRGEAGFRVEVDYRPNGHLGDETVEAVRVFGLYGNGVRP